MHKCTNTNVSTLVCILDLNILLTEIDIQHSESHKNPASCIQLCHCALFINTNNIFLNAKNQFVMVQCISKPGPNLFSSMTVNRKVDMVVLPPSMSSVQFLELLAGEEGEW